MESERILLFFEVRGIVPFRDLRRGGGKVRDFRIDDLGKESASGRAGLQSDVEAIPAGFDRFRRMSRKMKPTSLDRRPYS